MKIKTKIILYLVAFHLLLLMAGLPLIKHNRLWLIASELLVLISGILGVYLASKISRHLEIGTAGVEMLKSKDFSIKFVPTGTHETDQLIEVYNQMIDQLREERILKEEKNFFLEKLIEASPVGIIVFDFDQHVLTLNPVAYQLLDIEQDKTKDLTNFKSELLAQLNQVKVNETQTISIGGAKKYKCYKSHFMDRGFQRHFMIIEELTKEILLAEKNAYGKVIRMMAHEVNNSVGSVNSLLDSVRFYQNDLSPEKRTNFLEAIKIAIDRNQNMGIFMSNFADVIRLPLPEPKNNDLVQLIHQTVALMKPKALEKSIEIKHQIDVEHFKLLFDRVQMEQVLVNIVKNAMEAIESKGEICFIFSSKERKLQIRNNGKAISLNESAKLFTPFFSSRMKGQGIGLTLVRDILHHHGFRFSLYTAEDGLTYFEILV